MAYAMPALGQANDVPVMNINPLDNPYNRAEEKEAMDNDTVECDDSDVEEVS